MERFQIDQVELSLPVVFKVHQLEQAAHKQLLAELNKDRDFRLELPSRNGPKALERLVAACKALQVSLMIDPLAQERLKAAPLASSFAVYLDNVTPDELARLIQVAAQEDKKASGRKPLELQLDRLVLARMTPRDRKELAGLMGADPMQATPATSSATAPIDPRQPLTDLTARQVGEALSGQGGVPRPDAARPADKPATLRGVVLPYNAGRPAGAAVEIKRYLETRKAARPGTLRVLLVLRG
jgi:hypothetical protein